MDTTRRDFIRITSVAGAALVLGVELRADVQLQPFAPNPWLRVERDGTVVVIIGKQEMGQGVRTSLAMIVADELDADWAHVRLEQASTGPAYTTLNTGGSGSVFGAWKRLRPVAATARQMLVTAAAARLGVEASALRTENSAVIHDASSRRVTYGELTTDAAKLPVPQNVAPKSRQARRIVGTRRKRIDGPDIVHGRAKYGLDTRVPGMLYASIVRCPVVGGHVQKFDAASAKAIRGVRDVVPITSGVAIVAGSTWPALKARQALRVEW
ncbi:MAG TPA: molybdopterin cofactor-binding domain-containing protein, partial [Thermoanaerobaculia bacterium]